MSRDYQVEDTLISHPAWVELSFSALANNIRIVKEHLHPGAAAQSQANTGATRQGDPVTLTAIIKADAYGHGLVPMANMLQQLGINTFGIAQASEALALAHALTETQSDELETQAAPAPLAPDTPPRIFTWVYDPLADLSPLFTANIEVAASTQQQLQQISEAAIRAGKIARVHLKIDTGMARAGATARTWVALCERAFALQAAGHIEVVGIWSHLARADELDFAGRDATKQQETRFDTAVALAVERFKAYFPQQEPHFAQHLAASGGILFHPHSHHDMVRIGISMYGFSPDAQALSFAELGLEPVMTLRARITVVKRVPAGTPVSYGGTWVTPTERWLALVPVGYADGIFRQSAGDPQQTRAWLAGDRELPLPQSAAAFVSINGKNYPIVGRVCMDQMVVDLGEAPVLPALSVNDQIELGQEAIMAAATATADSGDPAAKAANRRANNAADLLDAAPVQAGQVVTILGADPNGPTADTWAAASGTINYEVLTAIKSRLPRIVIE